MEKRRHHHHLALPLIAAILLAGVAGITFAATPVTVTMSVTGDPVPGATVTAKAKVAINDGSTLQSITWTQTGGIKAILGTTPPTRSSSLCRDGRCSGKS